jgi:hypothetical protein
MPKYRCTSLRHNLLNSKPKDKENATILYGKMLYQCHSIFFVYFCDYVSDFGPNMLRMMK